MGYENMGLESFESPCALCLVHYSPRIIYSIFISILLERKKYLYWRVIRYSVPYISIPIDTCYFTLLTKEVNFAAI